VSSSVRQSAPSAAPAGEHWEAVSTTAISITGDVTFAPGRITFGNGKSLPLAAAGSVPGFGAPTGAVDATLYRVTAPDDPVLLHGNRLCGGRGPHPSPSSPSGNLPASGAAWTRGAWLHSPESRGRRRREVRVSAEHTIPKPADRRWSPPRRGGPGRNRIWRVRLASPAGFASTQNRGFFPKQRAGGGPGEVLT
jgi:hypothetical protein